MVAKSPLWWCLHFIGSRNSSAQNFCITWFRSPKLVCASMWNYIPGEIYCLRITLAKRTVRFPHVTSLCSYWAYFLHGGVLCHWRQRRHFTSCIEYLTCDKQKDVFNICVFCLAYTKKLGIWSITAYQWHSECFVFWRQYLVMMLGIFAVMAWFGSVIDNLFLTYLIGQCHWIDAFYIWKKTSISISYSLQNSCQFRDVPNSSFKNLARTG